MAEPIQSHIPAVSLNAALTTVIGDEGARSTGADGIATADFIPDTAQAAGGGANFCTLQLRQIRAGASLGVVGTLSLGANACVAETPLSFVLVAPASPWANDDEFDINVLQTGVGSTVPAGLVVIELA